MVYCYGNADGGGNWFGTLDWEGDGDGGGVPVAVGGGQVLGVAVGRRERGLLAGVLAGVLSPVMWLLVVMVVLAIAASEARVGGVYPSSILLMSLCELLLFSPFCLVVTMAVRTRAQLLQLRLFAICM